MRLDKFLKCTQLIKRRSVAKESAEEEVIKVNGRTAKPALALKENDIIEIDMWNYYKKIEVLKIPTISSIPKAKLDEYIKILDYQTKS